MRCAATGLRDNQFFRLRCNVTRHKILFCHKIRFAVVVIGPLLHCRPFMLCMTMRSIFVRIQRNNLPPTEKMSYHRVSSFHVRFPDYDFLASQYSWVRAASSFSTCTVTYRRMRTELNRLLHAKQSNLMGRKKLPATAVSTSTESRGAMDDGRPSGEIQMSESSPQRLRFIAWRMVHTRSRAPTMT